MADAPKPSGGGAWTALEIAIVLILAIAFLAQLRGKPVNTEKIVTERPDVQLTQQQPVDCGILVIRPRPLETVGQAVPTAGTISGCGWEPKNGVAAYARVYDAYGTIVSDYTPLTATKVKDVYSFAANVPLTIQPVPDTGYIVFYPASYNKDVNAPQETTAVIPVRFQ